MAEEAKLVSKWRPSWGRLKSIPFIGLLAGAAVVAPFVLNSFRENRRFDANADLPMPKDLADPLPPVLKYTAPEPFQPLAGVGDPHFGGPLIEGEKGRRIRMQRVGIEAGPDVTPPNILAANDVSVIDGQPLKDLNGKHVSNIEKEASSSFPGIG